LYIFILITEMNSTLNRLLNPIQQNPSTNYSLKHGNAFKKYQHKIKTKYTKPNYNTNYNLIKDNITEGFDTTSSQSLDDIKAEYNTTLDEYKTLLADISAKSDNYVKRTDTSNPYLNKFIKFNTGEICYVTNLGVAKYLPNISLIKSTGLQYNNTFIPVNIPFNQSWTTNPGTNIPTTPPLISGTNIDGSELGNEGNNVVVDKIISNTNSSYSGCYANNSNNPMTFIGDTPAPVSTNSNTTSNTIVNFVNGNFDTPNLQSNSFEQITSTTLVPGWDFNAILINKSNAMGYPQPYPNGNQATSIQRTQKISQKLNINVGTYTLTLFACRRNCCDNSGTSNPINIQLNGTTFYTLNPSNASWQYFSIPLSVTTGGNNIISFVGTSDTDRSTAIQNIQLSGARSGKYTYDSCKESAINGGFKYFALQNVDPFYSSGYCAVSNSYTTATTTQSNNCITMNDGNKGGIQGVNALYLMDDVGIPANIGKRAYIDGDSKLYPYPSDPNYKPPVGIPNTTPISIDSNIYQKYAYGGDMDKNEFGLYKITSKEQQQLTEIETKLNQLSEKIVSLTNDAKTTTNSNYNQLNINKNNANNYLGQIAKNNDNIGNIENNENGNILDNILNDSNVVVLQRNTNYLFISVLAITAILVSVYVLKK